MVCFGRHGDVQEEDRAAQTSGGPASSNRTMSAATSDLRLVLRGLRRSPIFSTVTIVSLALGIGANTAIFTLIDQLLLRRLPVFRPDQLVMLYQEGAHIGSNLGTRMHSH